MSKIIIPINPVPASRPRVSKFGVYYGKKHRQYLKDTELLIKRSETPKTSSVAVGIVFYIEIPKSKTKAFKMANNEKYHLQKPDIDNLIKLVLDILTDKNYWTDDNLVVKINAEKRWTLENPRTEIKIIEI